MYSISSYGKMIADQVRMAAYSAALRRSITPDSVVLDIGAGTGIFALLACSFGAKLVYAIEPVDAIQTAREIAIANDCAQRINFVQDVSTSVTLPQAADIIVSDLRGVLPLFRHHIGSIIDARKRLLSPGGVLIPQSDSLWAAVVSAPELYAEYVEPWRENSYGLNLGRAQEITLNTWRKARFKSEQLLTEPKPWAMLDYRTIENPDVHSEVEWRVTRGGIGHGLSVWFDTALVEGVGFSNGPDAPELIYGSAFFPWLKPVKLKAGDKLIVSLGADLVGEDYIWRWHTRICAQEHIREVKADFKQSTFFGVPISLEQLRKRSASHMPALNDEGEVEIFILSLMNGKRSLDEVACRLKLRFPQRFKDWTNALSRAGEVSLKYSRKQ